MRLAVNSGRRQCRVGTAEIDAEIAALFPCPRLEGINVHILDRQVARFEVNEKRRLGVERSQQRGLADAGRADNERLDALVLRHPLIGGDDLKLAFHCFLLCCCV
jgi:hypothetical protein